MEFSLSIAVRDELRYRLLCLREEYSISDDLVPDVDLRFRVFVDSESAIDDNRLIILISLPSKPLEHGKRYVGQSFSFLFKPDSTVEEIVDSLLVSKPLSTMFENFTKWCEKVMESAS